jgi:PAS domain S-box-containing protein
MVDVTARKKDEKKLRSQAKLLDLTHDAIFVRDKQSKITYWNRGAEELYGWQADQAIGRTSHELLRTFFPEPLDQIDEKLTRAGRWEGELVHTKRFGTPVIVASRWSLQRDEHGKPVAVLETNNDITEQKRIEQARQEIEEQWRAAFDSNPTMYFIVDATGVTISVNTFGAKQLGFRPDELIGQPVLNLFYEPDRAAVQARANECFRQLDRTMRWEARKVRKDGTIVWVRETANAVLLKKRPVLLVVCEDITEQKRAEEAARRSERELREAIESIPTIAWTAAPDGSSTFVNQRWTEYTGLSPQETMAGGWKDALHLDDLPGYEEAWMASLRTGAPFEYEGRFRAADGEYRWFLSRGVPLRDDDGKVVKWYGMATDIEDRKRAEQALQQSESNLAEAQRLTHTGSFIWDVKTGTASYVSDEWYRIYDFPPGSSREWHKWLNRFHPDDRSKWQAEVDRAIREKSDYELEYRIVLPDGATKYLHVIAHPVLDRSGDVAQFMGSVTDVTDRKRAEQESERLHELEADLAHMNRVTTMGELTASLSHEINQPIAAAVTNANTCIRWLAGEHPNIEEAREAAARIVKDANRAAAIISRIRLLFKKGSPQRERVDINEVIQEIVALLRNEAIRHCVSIRTEAGADVPMFMGDRVQLQQVVMNLMVNGIEAMKNSLYERVLTVTSGLGDGDRLLVSVSDTGSGLPANHDHIFDAFFTTKQDGTGMGLAISRSIIESHGGRLWATSKPQEGATFYFTLPIAVEASA